MRTLFASLISVAVLSAVSGFAAEPLRVKVMTQNMDAGTDFEFIFGATTPELLLQGVQATWAEIQASGIRERAARLAEEIAAHQPDLIALQEVTTYWKRNSNQPPEVQYDQLTLLLHALADHGLYYTPIVVNQLVQAEVPLMPDVLLGTQDVDVILVRSGITATNPQAAHFSHNLTVLGGLEVPKGWASVDITMGTRTFRFFNTHLESVFKIAPETVLLQQAQGAELAAVVGSTTLPAVLCGDFNGNANPGVQHFSTLEPIFAAGYVDAWRATNASAGNTWPLYQQDPFRPLAGPFERIDLILARGISVLSADRIGYRIADRTASGLWPSDHAGVIALIQLP